MEWMCRETMPIRRKLWQIPENSLCRLFLFWGPEEGIVEDFSSCHVRFCFGWDMLEFNLRINPAARQRNDDAVSTHCPHSEFLGLRKQCQQTFWRQTLAQFWHQADVCTVRWRSLSICTLRNSDISENVQTHRGCSQTCLILLVFVRLQVRGEWPPPFSLAPTFSGLRLLIVLPRQVVTNQESQMTGHLKLIFHEIRASGRLRIGMQLPSVCFFPLEFRRGAREGDGLLVLTLRHSPCSVGRRDTDLR